MRQAACLCIGIAALLGILPAQAQGTFQNLNFEQANPVATGINGPFIEVTAASAFPGWTVIVGGVSQTAIPENGASTGEPIVSLASASPLPPIDGNYGVYFYSSILPVSISQTGLIPLGSQSLMFEAQGHTYDGVGLEVLIGNQNIPISSIETGPNYTVFGADVSAWAGDTAQLTFSASGGNNGPSSWLIDDIAFSPVAIPEPNDLSLAVLGMIILGRRRWFARR